MPVIEESVCDKCNEIHKWSEQIEAKLTEAFPDWPVRSRHGGYPGNHPVISMHLKLWLEHHTECLVFAYDDCTESLCYSHVMELAKRMKGHNG